MEDFIREQIKDKPLNKKRIAIKLGVSALCGLVFALVACIIFALLLPRLTKENEQMPSDTQQESLTEIETETQQDTQIASEDPTVETIIQSLTIDDYQHLQNELYAIGSEANKSVVTITGVVSDTDWFNNSYESEYQGAGVIIKDTGSEYLILTEKKNFNNAEELSVTFVNDVVVEATMKKYDGNTGIAIVSVNKADIADSTLSTISVAEFGNSNSVNKGQITIALGSPLGTNYSILTGNITSTNNEISTLDDNYTVFTTDIVASQNGSGVLINLDGEVIGLVMQDYNKSDSDNTLTAVAISEVEPMIDLLMDGKDVPYIGLYVTPVTEKIAKAHDLPNGLYVKDVKMDSPAMLAGIQSGDVITQIDGTDVRSVSAYNSKLLTLSVGDTVKVTVMRKGNDGYSEITCQVEIGVL